MRFSVVENVPTPCDIICKLCTASQLSYTAKYKIIVNIKIIDFVVIPLADQVGAMTEI